uniref:ATP synthase F0 subunit 8 n=1 Tax=Statilia maculata TaxID=64626 RepID=A0A343C6H3_9NEOP|nr:ATP synthase F0 subunit 8 [Statilia maculata]ARJ54742.1 ATP synthase F0 subunit 8 [Statilia maculata]ASY97888.1 ATP synthase F0 subunit 8 [Statilia maculata]ASY98150.1 ATP synthase F0 subunit 8 [Statilia maculata]UUF67531.1 ATP synthase F0 subunit 8 [Statilia maculata]
MPQMMPLNWMMMFSFFSIMLIMFSILNYYTSYNKPTSLPIPKPAKKILTWKW